MTFQTPWVISDVVEVPLSVARLLAFIATAGKEGVVGPGDLQVRALGTPGSSVRIAKGAFAALNSFPSNDQQTYLGENDAEVTAAVTATGGTTRSDLVYVRINDTGQTGGGTSGPATIVVAQGVSPTITTLAEHNSSIAGIALARIDMPASTSIVQQSYITDLRKLVQPRRADIMRIANLPNGASQQTLTSTSFVNWPSEAAWQIDIPSWAVRAQVIGHIAGYQIVEGTSPANVWGGLRVQMGTLFSATTEYNHSAPSGAGKIDAAASMVAADFYIPKADRGTKNRNLRLEGKRDGGTANTNIRAAWGTVVTIQVVFYESPDDQYWEN
jgi:hypothetical protein